jgi:hypothetical protein
MLLRRCARASRLVCSTTLIDCAMAMCCCRRVSTLFLARWRRRCIVMPRIVSGGLVPRAARCRRQVSRRCVSHTSRIVGPHRAQSSCAVTTCPLRVVLSTCPLAPLLTVQPRSPCVHNLSYPCSGLLLLTELTLSWLLLRRCCGVAVDGHTRASILSAHHERTRCAVWVAGARRDVPRGLCEGGAADIGVRAGAHGGLPVPRAALPHRRRPAVVRAPRRDVTRRHRVARRSVPGT